MTVSLYEINSDELGVSVPLLNGTTDYVDLTTAADFINNMRAAEFAIISVFEYVDGLHVGQTKLWSIETVGNTHTPALYRTGVARKVRLFWDGTGSVVVDHADTADGVHMFCHVFSGSTCWGHTDGVEVDSDAYNTLDAGQSTLVRLGGAADAFDDEYEGKVGPFFILDLSGVTTVDQTFANSLALAASTAYFGNHGNVQKTRLAIMAEDAAITGMYWQLDEGPYTGSWGSGAVKRRDVTDGSVDAGAGGTYTGCRRGEIFGKAPHQDDHYELNNGVITTVEDHDFGPLWRDVFQFDAVDDDSDTCRFDWDPTSQDDLWFGGYYKCNLTGHSNNDLFRILFMDASDNTVLVRLDLKYTTGDGIHVLATHGADTNVFDHVELLKPFRVDARAYCSVGGNAGCEVYITNHAGKTEGWQDTSTDLSGETIDICQIGISSTSGAGHTCQLRACGLYLGTKYRGPIVPHGRHRTIVPGSELEWPVRRWNRKRRPAFG